MRKPFDGEFTLTQYFGVNKENYTRFGLQGHNGLDYGLPTNTPILAPHSGKVIEATLDPQGYGLYIKIENDKEGSVLAHQKELRVGVGDIVAEGQLIGYSDNSGNSTGPHLHWGYYLFPRNRQNGYAGFINQLPLLTQSNTVAVESKVFENLVRKSTTYDKVIDKLQVQDNETIVLQELDKLIAYEDAVIQKDKQLSETQNHANELDNALKVKEGELTTLQTQLKDLQVKTETALDENKVLSDEVAKLKESVAQPVLSGWKQVIFKILQNI